MKKGFKYLALATLMMFLTIGFANKADAKMFSVGGFLPFQLYTGDTGDMEDVSKFTFTNINVFATLPLGPMLNIGVQTGFNSLWSVDSEQTVMGVTSKTESSVNNIPILAFVQIEPPMIPLFFQAGLGLNMLSVSSKTEVGGQTQDDTSESKTRLGAMLGVGYAIPINPLMDIPIIVQYHIHNLMLKEDTEVNGVVVAEEKTSSGLIFGVGIRIGF